MPAAPLTLPSLRDGPLPLTQGERGRSKRRVTSLSLLGGGRGEGGYELTAGLGYATSIVPSICRSGSSPARRLSAAKTPGAGRGPAESRRSTCPRGLTQLRALALY